MTDPYVNGILIRTKLGFLLMVKGKPYMGIHTWILWGMLADPMVCHLPSIYPSHVSMCLPLTWIRHGLEREILFGFIKHGNFMRALEDHAVKP